jgi:hypothetical protein
MNLTEVYPPGIALRMWIAYAGLNRLPLPQLLPQEVRSVCLWQTHMHQDHICKGIIFDGRWSGSQLPLAVLAVLRQEKGVVALSVIISDFFLRSTSH